MNADLHPVWKEDSAEGLLRKVELLGEGEAAREMLGRLRNEDSKVHLEGPRAELLRSQSLSDHWHPLESFRGLRTLCDWRQRWAHTGLLFWK